MTTTITLTPTLTLSVADQRMKQSSIEAMWATITQYIRATGRTAKIAVLDGTELLRMWELAPDGTRTPIELDPATTPETASFRLTLSPWMMSVPYDSGPDLREVSTLAVARAQATEAATAGGVELILQTIGTDEDSAQTIEPVSPETVTATQALTEDTDEDLFDELAEEDGDAPDEATHRFRRRAIIGGAALSLVLLGSLTAGGWAMLHDPEPTTAPAAQDTSATAEPSATPEASESAQEQVPHAVAPDGFSGTPAWEVVGATDQSSGLSWDGKHVGAVSGRALDVVDTETGEVTDSTDLPAALDSGPHPLRDGDDGGLLMPAEDQIMTWSTEHGLVESEISEDDRLVLRGTTAFTVPQNDDTRPDAIQVVTTEGLKEYTSPGSSASPIGPARTGGILWASNEDGGSLIHANAEGEEESRTRLIGPSEGTTILSWLGATEDYAAAIWANDGSGSILTIHDAETGKVVDTTELGSTGAGAGMQIVPSIDGKHLIAGTTLVNLDTGTIGDTVTDITSTSQAVEAVPGGWVAAQTDGTQMLLSPEGETQDSPETTESLLGLTESGDIVADNRGAIAAFTPAPETEGGTQ